MIGARFYSSVLICNGVGDDILNCLPIRGTLLLLRASKKFEDERISEGTFLLRSQFDESDYPSVRLWNIEADGFARILEAALLDLASDQEVMAIPLAASLLLSYALDIGLCEHRGSTEREGDRNRSIDLREWEKNWLRSSRKLGCISYRCKAPGASISTSSSAPSTILPSKRNECHLQAL